MYVFAWYLCSKIPDGVLMPLFSLKSHTLMLNDIWWIVFVLILNCLDEISNFEVENSMMFMQFWAASANQVNGGKKMCGRRKERGNKKPQNKKRIYWNRRVCYRHGLTFLIWGGRTAGLIYGRPYVSCLHN